MIPRLPKGFSHPMTIGEGSFSSVYRVRQNTLDRWVAVKILHEKNRTRRLELLEEARNQAQMSISCIPSVYDAFGLGQQVFIVMEWIKGASLLTLLQNGIPNPSDRAALASAIIAALAGLHKLGFAHRDVKPANILVTAEGIVYLVDFGFSKKVGEGERSVAGTVKGTPAYMAPEIWQVRGAVDFMKADLFALGKVLRELAPGGEWEPLIGPLLAADPSERPGSAASLWETCRTLPVTGLGLEGKASIVRAASLMLSGQLVQAGKQLLFARREEEAYWLLAESLQEDPDGVEALQLMEAFPALSRRKRRNRGLAAVAAALALCLALAAAFHFGRRSERERRFPSVAAESGTGALLLPPHPSAKRSAGMPVRFREIGQGGNRLAGRLFLENAGGCDSLFLDAHAVTPPPPGEGMAVEPGEHALVCLDGAGGLLYREKTSLLPFQRKIIRIRFAAAGKDV